MRWRPTPPPTAHTGRGLSRPATATTATGPFTVGQIRACRFCVLVAAGWPPMGGGSATCQAMSRLSGHYKGSSGTCSNGAPSRRLDDTPLFSRRAFTRTRNSEKYFRKKFLLTFVGRDTGIAILHPSPNRTSLSLFVSTAMAHSAIFPDPVSSN
jgi:hypothetical protein